MSIHQPSNDAFRPETIQNNLSSMGGNYVRAVCNQNLKLHLIVFKIEDSIYTIQDVRDID